MTCNECNYLVFAKIEKLIKIYIMDPGVQVRLLFILLLYKKLIQNLLIYNIIIINRKN